MPKQQYDAIIELDNFLARLRPLSWATRAWLETHVTLEQVQTWTGSVLEVAAYHIGDLVTDMLDDGLQVATVRGRVIEQRSQYAGIIVV
jgi:hypothetical protein